MLEFRDITLEDKVMFDKWIKTPDQEISELNFTNFYMWRLENGFRYTIHSGFFVIISIPLKGEPYAFCPIGEGSESAFNSILEELKEYFYKNSLKLTFMKCNKEQAERIKAYFKENSVLESDRDNCDYLYLTEDMIHLKGKKFDAKRNHINKFKKNSQFEFLSMKEEHIEECIRINNEWCKTMNCNKVNHLFCENRANLELIKNFRFLGCEGALIKVNDKFEAFTMGEMLNSQTAVIHIEKGNFAIPGIYQFINQQFCENTWKSTQFINREQDLGLEGLRKAKESYHPLRLVEKYKVEVLE